MLTADRLIELLDLRPLRPEGGYFRQTYLSDETIGAEALPGRYGRAKPFGAAIYYLLTDDPDSFSALHGLPTEEIYHFYLGDPVELLMLHPDGRGEPVILGHDLLNGQRVQHVVPRGVWQGSRLVHGGRVALMGTTMAPGYDEQDYTPGVREELIARYPTQADRIRALTRG
jgi:predicted cupin superfamily sugar epimerase